MLGPELRRRCRQLVAILVAAAALAAMPATANAFGPAVTLTTDPVAPVSGQNGWFNDMDLAQSSGRVRVNVSATDSATSTVILLSCTGGTLAGETGSDPRTAHIDLTTDGEHVVSCTADNADGRTGPAATTTVKIDRTPPDLGVPNDITATPTGIFGAHVTWTTTPADTSCNPPSGSAFAAGTTTVTCTATDQAGNTTTKTFTVHVKSGAELLDDLFASYSTGWAG